MLPNLKTQLRTRHNQGDGSLNSCSALQIGNGPLGNLASSCDILGVLAKQGNERRVEVKDSFK